MVMFDLDTIILLLRVLAYTRVHECVEEGGAGAYPILPLLLPVVWRSTLPVAVVSPRGVRRTVAKNTATRATPLDRLILCRSIPFLLLFSLGAPPPSPKMGA